MKTRWLEKDVKLSLLCSPIQGFFIGRGFKVRVETKSENEFVVFATRKIDQKTVSVTIKVHGNSNDFTIEFVTPIKESVSLFSPFLQLIGLGGWYYYQLRQKEIYDVLEKEFWTFMDGIVENLAGSASR